jgi:hypothetical protein
MSHQQTIFLLDRRTFKDVITFIPFVIILLIPLSPIGHVLVFGAIQRFFPDFFPSCFTEQRQNLLQLYENAEYSKFTIDENWRVSPCKELCERLTPTSYFFCFQSQEKLARVSEAFLYLVANTSRTLYTKLYAQIRGDKSDGDDSQ